jgi:hypothetical protein
MPAPTPEQLERWRKEVEEGVADRARWIPHTGPFTSTSTPMPLHSTQVRAYAIQAAANLPLANLRPSSTDLAAWYQTVMDAADLFTHYIETGEH